MSDVQNLVIDKVNGDLAFNEEMHKYWNVKDPTKNYTSVTTLISNYYEPFNEEFFSRYKALQEMISESEFKTIKSKMLKSAVWKDEYNTSFGISNDALEVVRQDLLARWKAKNKESTDYGTAYHLKRELEWYEAKGDFNKIATIVNGYGLDRGNNDFYCEKHNFDLSRENAVMPEYLLYYSSPDDVIHLAGQADIIIKRGNKIYIMDFKTNADGIKDKAAFDVRKRSTKKMYFPVNNLEDTTMMHYNLQLSIYAWMLQKINPEFEIELLRLIHVDREGVETYHDVPYLKEEVTRLLLDWKRKIKIKKAKGQ